MRGLFLAVTTLALAVATPWILERPIFQTDGQSTTVMQRPVIGSFSLASERTYYWVCLGVLALAIIGVARLGGVASGAFSSPCATTSLLRRRWACPRRA